MNKTEKYNCLRTVLLKPQAPFTQKGTPCQRPAFKHNGRCSLHGGLSTGAKTADGLTRISDANLKRGKYTKDKLEAQRHAAKVGRQVKGKLKRIEKNLERDIALLAEPI